MDIGSRNLSAQDAKRDLEYAETTAWSQRPFPLPGPREPGIRVIVRQSVLNEVHRHGHSRTDVEICGVLVGNGYQDSSGAFLYIESSIRGEHAAHQAAQVTFTADTWQHIQDVMEREHVNRRIIGWYHTHPGFGIFLSEMDLFIHQNFFGSPEQTALVYDPLSGEEGFFIWRGGNAVRESVAIDPDAELVEEIQAPAAGDRLRLAHADQEGAIRPVKRRRVFVMTMSLLIVLALSVFWRIPNAVWSPSDLTEPLTESNSVSEDEPSGISEGTLPDADLGISPLPSTKPDRAVQNEPSPSAHDPKSADEQRSD